MEQDYLKKKDGETQSEYIKRIVQGILVDKSIPTSEYENLSELLFGEGNCFNSSEVRKRCYGIKAYIEALENDKYNNVATKILSISDVHSPFNLPIDIFSDYINKVDILQLNGDILDMQQISRFPKTYRVSVMEEIILGRQYIINLIEYIKPKRVVINHGNHELRFASYLSKNLDSDLLELMPQTALDLIIDDGFNHYDKRNKTKTWYEPLSKVFTDIEIVYTKDWHCQIGDIIFCHPNTYSSSILKTAEKAMYFFRNEGYSFSNLVLAHTHRIGEYTIGNTTIYEQGTCSDVSKLNYLDGQLVNSQKEGFMYICQDSKGSVIKDKTKLIVLN